MVFGIPPYSIIDKNIYIFLYVLMKKIFLVDKSDKISKKYLDVWLNIINNKIIKDKSKNINTDYSIKNFINILSFIKSQNSIYAGDILEGILILIFDISLKVDKDMTLNKYLSNNMSLAKKNGFILELKFDSFVPSELKNMDKLLSLDSSVESIIYGLNNQKQNKCIFLNLLYEIFIEKYLNHHKRKANKKIEDYIFRDANNIIDIEKKIKDSFSTNKPINLNEAFKEPENKIKIKIIQSFIISVFIYHQNKNAPLKQYNKPSSFIDNEGNKKELSNIPFKYDLSSLGILGTFSHIYLAPVRIDPQINEVVLIQNELIENSFLELSKVLVFNKNIKKINLSRCLIKNPLSLVFFNYGFGIFDNNSIEELHIDLNYMNENFEENLEKFLIRLNGLKTINLSNNEMKDGISFFFILLKNLYREKKTKLEKLLLTNCCLDRNAFYELGELIKCKHCKLKILVLNSNIIPTNVNFLKKIKKNKNLTNIYFGKAELDNKNVDNIMRTISNTNIKQIYLYKNRIPNFDNLLKMVYRTKLVTSKKEKDAKKICRNEVSLMNLDISDNYCDNKNPNNIKLFNNIINETTLFCLDISHVLLDNKKNITKNKKYLMGIDSIKELLDKNKNNYRINMKKFNDNEIDIKKYNNLDILEVCEGNKEIAEKIEDKISEIIMNENSKFPLFLREEAKRIIINILNEENDNSFKKKIINENKNINYEEFNNVQEILYNYILLRKAKEYNKHLNLKIKDRKLIII